MTINFYVLFLFGTFNNNIFCELKIPFASFVDHKMIKEKRLNGIINKTIDSQIIAVQKQYEIKKNAVID